MEALPSADTRETPMRRADAIDRPVKAPSPTVAHQRRPRAGADTQPATIWPSSSRAIRVAHTGTPRTKLEVPSMGSMIQRRPIFSDSSSSVRGEEAPSSSPRTWSRDRADFSVRRMAASTAWSDSVT